MSSQTIKQLKDLTLQKAYNEIKSVLEGLSVTDKGPIFEHYLKCLK